MLRFSIDTTSIKSIEKSIVLYWNAIEFQYMSLNKKTNNCY